MVISERQPKISGTVNHVDLFKNQRIKNLFSTDFELRLQLEIDLQVKFPMSGVSVQHRKFKLYCLHRKFPWSLVSIFMCIHHASSQILASSTIISKRTKCRKNKFYLGTGRFQVSWQNVKCLPVLHENPWCKRWAHNPLMNVEWKDGLEQTYTVAHTLSIRDGDSFAP